jgi:hypothetical protein
MRVKSLWKAVRQRLLATKKKSSSVATIRIQPADDDDSNGRRYGGFDNAAFASSAYLMS